MLSLNKSFVQPACWIREIDVRPSKNQIDDLLEEIDERVKKNERVLVTTLTKRMAEELTKYMDRVGIKCRYIHSEVTTLDRVEILRELRLGRILMCWLV